MASYPNDDDELEQFLLLYAQALQLASAEEALRLKRKRAATVDLQTRSNRFDRNGSIKMTYSEQFNRNDSNEMIQSKQFNHNAMLLVFCN